MNLHEYQSKQLLSSHDLPIQKSYLLQTPSQISEVLEFFSEHSRIVAKIQIHAGGRGKVGGVQILDCKQESLDLFIQKYLHQYVHTHQTTPQGQYVSAILFEAPSEIEKEFYLGMIFDREKKCISLLASSQGGVDIESHGHDHMHSLSIFSASILPHHAWSILNIYKLDKSFYPDLFKILNRLHDAFIKHDLSLLEINPFVLTKENKLLILDAKLSIDDNSVYRQLTLASSYDETQDDPKEVAAKQSDLNYIALDGEIGCLVNGAGLAMATMDLIHYAGGKPANFLDVGGTANEERVKKAVEIILQDPNVKVIFINIFGGIVRCDIIANGILGALKDLRSHCSFVVRLQGNQSDQAKDVLSSSSLSIVVEQDFLKAAQQAVRLSKDII